MDPAVITSVNQKVEKKERTKKNEFKNAQMIAGSLQSFRNYFLGILVFALLTTVSILVVYFAKLDLEITSIQLEGNIISSLNGEPVEGVTIVANNSEVTSNASGNFTIEGLKDGELRVSFIGEDYVGTTILVDIRRNFLDYSQNIEVVLDPAGVGIVTGQLISPDENALGIRGALSIADEPVRLSLDGSFTSDPLPIGMQRLEFFSDSFSPLDQIVEVRPGRTDIGEINLSTAATIRQDLISYVREDPVTEGVEIIAQNIRPEQILIDIENSFFEITNLEEGVTYSIRVTADGYQTRDYMVTAKSGLNVIPNFRLVEEGTAHYAIEEPGDDGRQIHKADYDGTNIERLTNVEELDPFNVYIDSEANQIYFQSEYERIRATTSGRVPMAYILNLENNDISRAIESEVELGFIVPSYQSSRYLNISRESGRNGNEFMEIVLANGIRERIIEFNVGSVVQAVISPGGEYVYYVFRESSVGSEQLWRYNVESGELRNILENQTIRIFDVTESGSRALIETSGSNFLELQLYDDITSEFKTLLRNSTGTRYQFREGSISTVYYLDPRGGTTDIFSINVDSLVETKVTTTTPRGEVEHFYQQLGLIYYTADGSLFVLDPDKPRMYKKVVDGNVGLL